MTYAGWMRLTRYGVTNEPTMNAMAHGVRPETGDERRQTTHKLQILRQKEETASAVVATPAAPIECTADTQCAAGKRLRLWLRGSERSLFFYALDEVHDFW